MKRKIFLIIAFTCTFSFAYAQWQYVGLDSMHVINCLATNGESVFAGTGINDKGLLVSNDNGLSWSETNTGITFYDHYRGIFSLAINGTKMFAGTYHSGVFSSTDSGQTWTAINSGFPAGMNFTVTKIAISDTTIFASIIGYGIYRSINNGSSWIIDTIGLTNSTIRGFAINGTNIFAGTNYGGVFLSTNNGENWVAMNNGLSVSGKNIYSLTAYGTNLIAGTQGGMYLSADTGSSWISVNSEFDNCEALSFAVTETCIFAGMNQNRGVYLSTDSGLSWSSVGLSGLIIQSLAVNKTYIYAGTYDNGVWRRPLSDFTGINSLNKNNSIIIFPNPVTDKISIIISEKSRLEIFNSKGQIVKSFLYDQEKSIYDVSDLSSGIYIIKASTSKGILTKKFIKQ